MKMHVFAIDILPSSKFPSTGGGMRSRQIIDGLKMRGVEVTYSLPRQSDSVKKHWTKLSSNERELAFDLDTPGRTPLDILDTILPDAAVFLWPKLFTFPRSLKKNIVIIYDANGLQNVETAVFESAISGRKLNLQQATEDYLNTLKCADLIITGSLSQQAYWTGLSSFVNNSMDAINSVQIPFVPEFIGKGKPYLPGEPNFFISGSFLPWNSPGDWIGKILKSLESKKRGKLTVVGKANPLLPHAKFVNGEISKYRESKYIELIDEMPFPEFSEMILRNGIAFDLHSRTFERELALPIRTLTYLSHGVPVIANNYSVIGKALVKHGAGWSANPENDDNVENLIEDILDGKFDGALSNMSDNCEVVLREEFDSDTGFKELMSYVEQIKSKEKNENRHKNRNIYFAERKKFSPVVLVMTDDMENFLTLRIKIPFDAMYRMGLISGYIILQNAKVVHQVGEQRRLRSIDALWVQRGALSYVSFLQQFFPGQYNLDLDDNLFVTPVYRTSYAAHWIQGLHNLIADAGSITTTTPRLTESLKRSTGIQFEHKVHLAPNLAENVFRRRFKTKPEALLLASSDRIPLTTSRAPFFAAISAFAKNRDLPLFYVGTAANNFPDFEGDIFETGFLNYSSYMSFLRNENILAVAPLDSHADPVTQEFINCKSDIKAVEFASLGIPALYADVPPYRESPLAAGPLVDCSDSKAIIDVLERMYLDPDADADHCYDTISCQRLADVVVGDTWYRAIEAVRLPVAQDFDALMHKLVLSRTSLQPGQSIISESDFNPDDYLAMNPDVVQEIKFRNLTPYQHYILHGQRDGRVWFPATYKGESISISAVRNEVLNQLSAFSQLEYEVNTLLNES